MSDYVYRFSVRTAHKKWTDRGPDLLRPYPNARKALKSAIIDKGPYYIRNVSGDKHTDIMVPFSLAEVMDHVDAWKRQTRWEQLVVRNDSKPIAYIKRTMVPLKPTPDCSPDTVLARSLIEAKFPDAIFAGGYVWKQISGTSDWSDHAWGTAIDEKESPPGVTNDEMFDWCVRMALSGCMKFDYIIGSRKGNVVISSAPDYDVVPSSASSSHLWHIHVSVVDHDGRRPPVQGGWPEVS